MAAIITQQFRRRTAELFLSEIRQEINTTDNIGVPYYVGIGKSDKWVADENATYNVPLPSGTPNEQREILSNLITLIKILPNNVGLVIPNVKYKTGSYFKEYNPSDESCFYPDLLEGGFTQNPCYTINNDRIYLCLRAGLDGVSVSTQAPISSGIGAPAESKSDGYVWVLLDELDRIDEDIVNSDQFITTSRFTDKEDDTLVISASGTATGGLLYGFNIINGGIDYTDGAVIPSTIPFKCYAEDGTPYSINCSVTYDNITGAITSVKLPTTWDYTLPANKKIVNGYFDFSSYSTGSGAVIIANIAPSLGFYYNSANILPTWYISIAVAAKDNISGDGLFIPYREISVIRNPQYSTSLTTTTDEPSTLRALHYIELSGNPPNDLIIGDILTFSNGTKVIYDTYDFIDNQKRIFFHQNDKSGYGQIPLTSTDSNVQYSRGGSTYNIPYTLVAASGEYNDGTGEVIFTESRTKIERAKSQAEEIKIIIQF